MRFEVGFLDEMAQVILPDLGGTATVAGRTEGWDIFIPDGAEHGISPKGVEYWATPNGNAVYRGRQQGKDALLWALRRDILAGRVKNHV
jgi:hypothetical protein